MKNAYEITDYVREAHRVDQKLAKIHQEKFGSVKEKYNIKWKTLASAVKAPVASNPANNVLPFSNVQTEVPPTEVNNVNDGSNVVPFPNVQSDLTTTKVDETRASVDSNVIPFPGTVQNTVDIDKVANKHNRVSKIITAFDKNYQISTLYLNGARKIRTSQDTKNKTSEYSDKMGTMKFCDVVETKVNEFTSTAIQTPSVDKYFQNHSSVSDGDRSIQGQVDRITNIKNGCDRLDIQQEQAEQEIERARQDLDKEEMEWTMIFEEKQAKLLRTLAELDAIKNAKNDKSNGGMRLAG